MLTLVYALFLVLTTVVGGSWSDRLGRRKPFVVASGLVIGAAALVLAAVQTWAGAIAGAVVLGVGYGIYTAVDYALVSEVLPAANARAKDLGMINIANALPQVVAPLLASLLVAVAGYALLYAVAALVCVLGAYQVRRIRGVR